MTSPHQSTGPTLTFDATTVGTIGATATATAVARRLLLAGRNVLLANSRGPATLDHLVHRLGPGATATTRTVTATAPIVVLAVPWSRIPDAVADLPPWDGRIVIDTTNPLEAPTYRPADLHGRTSSEVVADLVPGARLAPFILGPLTQGGRLQQFPGGPLAALDLAQLSTN